MHRGVAHLMLGALAMSLLAGAWPMPAFAGERHSGTVVTVDSTARTLVLDEIGARAKERVLRVRLAPQARVTLSERLPDDQVTDLRQPFKDTPISLAALRPGDFVVVELRWKGKTAEASTVTVTFRGGSR